jgi:hypothetical protein
MSMHPSGEDVKREIQATLAARRELGPEYDEHFLDALVEKLTKQVATIRQAPPPAPPRDRFNAKQRNDLAIASLLFAIPLIAIAGGEVGVVGIAFACAAIVAVNLIATLM